MGWLSTFDLDDRLICILVVSFYSDNMFSHLVKLLLVALFSPVQFFLYTLELIFLSNHVLNALEL